MKTIYVAHIEEVTLTRKIVIRCEVPDDHDGDLLDAIMEHHIDEVEIDSDDHDTETLSLELASDEDIALSGLDLMPDSP